MFGESGKQSPLKMPTGQTNLAMTFTWECHTMSEVASRNVSLPFDSKVTETYNLPVI